jgi:hypothetical protein
MRALGKRTWVIAGGHIPLESTGREPENTSRDELCFLNSGRNDAKVDVMLVYSDRDPVGPYELTVRSERLRRVRVNDLINPEAPPLDTDYGIVIESDQRIVVQLERKDTSRSENAIATTMGFPA